MSKVAWVGAHRWWLWFTLVGILLASLTHFALDLDSVLWFSLNTGMQLVGVILTVVFAMRFTHRSTRRFWFSLAGFQLLTMLGDVIYNAQTYLFGEPYGYSLADAFYALSYVAGFIAAGIIVRSLTTRKHDETWIDAMIIALAGIGVVGVLVISNTVVSNESPVLDVVIAACWPIADIIILAAIIRVVASSRTPNIPLVLTSVAMTLYFIADMLYNATIFGSGWSDTDRIQNFFYTISFIIMAAAVLSPGANTAAVAPPAGRSATEASRVGWLTLGISISPILLAVQVWMDPSNPVIRLLAATSVLVIGLVLWRVRRLLQTVESQAVQIAAQARTDALTGLPNRRTLDFHMTRLARQSPQNLTVAMLDLDHFKQYNDTHGHQSADRLLTATARAWSKVVRPPHIIARYGGEEFTAIFTGLSTEDVGVLLERARLATPDDQTVSIGYAVHIPGEDISETLRRADKAMYHSKESGRNRVTFAPADTPLPT